MLGYIKTESGKMSSLLRLDKINSISEDSTGKIIHIFMEGDSAGDYFTSQETVAQFEKRYDAALLETLDATLRTTFKAQQEITEQILKERE